MAAALFAAAVLPALANAEDDGFDELLDDDSHLVDELLADEQSDLKPESIDFSNHTWKEFVSYPLPRERCCQPSMRIRLKIWAPRGPFSLLARRLTIT